jgi:hypothetical protein
LWIIMILLFLVLKAVGTFHRSPSPTGHPHLDKVNTNTNTKFSSLKRLEFRSFNKPEFSSGFNFGPPGSALCLHL